MGGIERSKKQATRVVPTNTSNIMMMRPWPRTTTNTSAKVRHSTRSSLDVNRTPAMTREISNSSIGLW